MILGQKTSRNNSHCKLNLRCDGVNDGTSFVDSSSSGKTIDNVSNIVLTKTAIKKYGSASGYWDGNDAHLGAGGSGGTDYNFGSGDWTVEGWFYLSVLPVSPTHVYAFFDQYTTSTNYNIMAFYHNGSNHNLLLKFINSGTLATNTALEITLSTDTWFYIAIVRTGNVIKVFKDGIQFGGDVAFTADFPLILATMNIGVEDRDGYSTYDFKGNIDGYLVHKGAAKYTRNFTPPNRAA